jgi:mitochondrial import receptor subunit TOM40
MLLMGTISGAGVLMSRCQWRPTEEVAVKYEARIQGAGYSPMFMGDLEYSGADWNGQLKMGYGGFWGGNYMQSISPNVSAGGEVFYLQQQGRSGVGLALRVHDEKAIGTLQARP